MFPLAYTGLCETPVLEPMGKNTTKVELQSPSNVESSITTSSTCEGNAVMMSCSSVECTTGISKFLENLLVCPKSISTAGSDLISSNSSAVNSISGDNTVLYQKREPPAGIINMCSLFPNLCN